MIKLYVKGTQAEARAAAHDRGIVVKDGVYNPIQTVLLTHETFLKKVTDWFCEPGFAPYPPGSLLHYVMPEKSDRAMTFFGALLREPTESEWFGMQGAEQDLLIGYLGDTELTYSPSSGLLVETYDEHGSYRCWKLVSEIRQDPPDLSD